MRAPNRPFLLFLTLLALAAIALVEGRRAGAQGPAQFTWVRTITLPGTRPNGAAFGVVMDSAGNVIAAGRVSPGGNSRQLLVVKYDPAGNQLWQRTLPDPSGATAVAVDASDAVIAVGFQQVAGVFQSVVAKWDALGNPQWTASFSPDAATPSFAQVVTVDGNGDVIAGGAITDLLSFSTDWAVARFRGSDGGRLWTRRGRGTASPGNNSILDLAVDGGNNVAAAGYGQTGGGPFGFLVMRLRGDTGVPFWSLFDGDPNAFDQAVSVAVDHGDNVVAGGFFTVGGQRLLTVAEYDRDTGTRRWIDQSVGGGDTSATISSVRVNSQGNPVGFGFVGSGTRTLDVAVAAYNDLTGVPLWKSFVPPSVSGGFAFVDRGALDPQDRLVAAGGSGGNNPIFEDFTAWQFDAPGNLARTLILPSNGDGEALTVAADRNGNIAAGGYHIDLLLPDDVQFTVAYAGPAGAPLPVPTDLAFGQQPTSTTAGAPINPAVTVRIVDAARNAVAGATGPVTLTLDANPGGGALGGTTTVAAVNGIATFNNLTVNRPGEGYTLRATTPGLPGRAAVSQPFNVTPGAATHFQVTAPATVTAGNAFTFTVTALDAANNTAAGYTGTARFTSSDPGAELPPDTPFTAADRGVRAFDARLKKAGIQTLTATDTVNAAITGSAAITVSPAPAANLIFEQQPTNTDAGAPISPAVTVRIVDAFGNTVPTAASPVTLAIGANPGGGLLFGMKTVAPVNGVATFPGLSIDQPGAGYTLAPTAAGLAGPFAPSSRFDILANAPRTFVVTTASDIVSAADNVTSLREAILEANAHPGADVITFRIPGPGERTLRPASPLPFITDPVTLDGYTQPQARANTLATGSNAVLLIEIDGSSAGTGADGLTVTAGNSTIRGLVVNRFRPRPLNHPDGGGLHGVGIRLQGEGRNAITGCYLGTNTAGSVRLENRTGVLIDCPNNTIGGDTPAAVNLISGNAAYGAHLNGPAAAGNRVYRNLIGTNRTGTAALANVYGVRVEGGPDNSIGGPAPETGNLISGNTSFGVYILGATATRNVVQRNLIGTDAVGALALPNDGGVVVWNAPENTVGPANVVAGGTFGIYLTGTGATRNVVLGNNVGTDASGRQDLGTTNGIDIVSGASRNRIGGTTTAARNLVSGNHVGIAIFDGGPDRCTENVVQGNFVGTDVSGSAALPNDGGILIDRSRDNLIGGDFPEARNVISGNTLNGVTIRGAGAAGNRVQGNYIGTQANGTAFLRNAVSGVVIERDAGGNLIGGPSLAAGNVLSGNTRHGLHLLGSGNVVQGNRAGTRADGRSALENRFDGILIEGADNLIGGTAPEAGNVLSGNRSAGVALLGAAAARNVIQGNRIGTDVDGAMPIPNAGFGVYVSGAPGAAIGGTTGGAGNLVSGNPTGIFLDAAAAVLQGNRIGTDMGGTRALANGTGVQVRGSGNLIGGTQEAARNVISGNTLYGVRLEGGSATGNRVQGNRIGTNFLGNGAVANGIGISIGSGASRNVIGGKGGARNLISGNTEAGVWIIDAASRQNSIQGNYIGTDASGTAAVSNYAGIRIWAPDNFVEAGNVISGNTGSGVVLRVNAAGTRIQGNRIGTNAAGTAAVGNRDFGVLMDHQAVVTIGGSGAAGNLISGNDVGVNLFGASWAVVQGNRIGTDASGFAPVPNNVGVRLGRLCRLYGNLISGNRADGIEILEQGNVAQGNRIGTNLAGTAALSNGGGVRIENAPNNLIGGWTAGAGNVISGHNRGSGTGIWIAGAGATNNHVNGNLIGTDSTGATALPNDYGIFIANAPGNIIGGAAAGHGNVLSGNIFGVGIYGSTGNIVAGNLVGLNAAGAAAIPNDTGVSVQGGAGNTIGGTTAGARNVISGNFSAGVVLWFGGGNHTVLGNFIGTDAGGVNAVPNGEGVAVSFSANNVVGGTVPGAGNLISGNFADGVVVGSPGATGTAVLGNRITSNGEAGVLVVGGATSQITVRANAIFGNTGLAIDLSASSNPTDGVTANDLRDLDTGPNALQNCPVLHGAAAAPGSVTIAGSLHSTPGTSFILDFYRCSTPHPSGTGEAEAYLGSTTVTISAFGGTRGFGVVLPVVGDLSGQYFAATASRIYPGNRTETSEFSQAVRAPDRAVIVNGNLVVTGTPVADTLTVDATNPSDVRVSLNGTPVLNPAGGPFVLDPAAGRSIILGLAGNDVITVRGSVPAEVHGGDGLDTIAGGAGSDVLWGEEGADTLQDGFGGRAGRGSRRGHPERRGRSGPARRRGVPAGPAARRPGAV